MPRYVYNCKSCGGYFEVWHGMKEVQESCQLCNSQACLTRVPQIPSIKKEEQVENKIGSVTKDFIEKNQELLKDMKKEARNQIYDD